MYWSTRTNDTQHDSLNYTDRPLHTATIEPRILVMVIKWAGYWWGETLVMLGLSGCGFLAVVGLGKNKVSQKFHEEAHEIMCLASQGFLACHRHPINWRFLAQGVEELCSHDYKGRCTQILIRWLWGHAMVGTSGRGHGSLHSAP